MPSHPSADEPFDRLHRAGWSVGEVRTMRGTVLVSGTNGENRIQAEGKTSAEAWYRACQEAESVGMLR